MSSVSSEGLDEFYGAQLSLFTIIHHQDHFAQLVLGSLHSDDFRKTGLLMGIF
jgi:hypothetical protein